MATLKDVVAYICQNYPDKDELSKARLTKLVYLSDWKMAIGHGRQISPARWYFNRFGPYVYDIEQLTKSDDDFEVERTPDPYGSLKEIVRLKRPLDIQLQPAERDAVDFSIEKTQALGWDAFLKLIYSTYPIVTESRYDYLDLPALAEEYRGTFSLAELPQPAMDNA